MTTKQLSEDELLAVKQLIQGAGGMFDFDLVIKGLIDNNWIIHPVRFRDTIIGGILQKEADIHTSITPEYQKKWNPRFYINKILYPALEKYGVITSLSDKNDQNSLNWLLKLGFEITGEDEKFHHLTLKTIKFRYKK